jgi:hypothetical protein
MSESDKKQPVEVGGDQTFLVAWGNVSAALSVLVWVCILLTVALLAMVGLCAYVARQNVKPREAYVFMKDNLGNVVQVDPNSVLKAGETRDDMEVKGFVKNWVLNAYSFTPLDVRDKALQALSFVDAKALGVAKASLRLPERAKIANAGNSMKVRDEPEKEKGIQFTIKSRKPLEVLVSFERYLVSSDGKQNEYGRLFVTVQVKQVPRTPSNPNGLIITDINTSETLN